FQASLMRNMEREWVPRIDLNVVVSEQDKERLRRIAPNARFTVVPNGVDTNYFSPAAAPEAGLVFVGGHGWYPNRDAMSYFAEAILPHVRRAHPDLPVTWVGRCPENIAVQYAGRYGIRVTGYVEDIRPYVAGAACYIVPIRVGGGTRLKILDAWAMGKAVVS